KDPALRRLYLLHPAGSGDLAEHLAEQRFLLGLDFLHVADTSGAVIADAATAATAGAAPLEVRALPTPGPHGPTVEALADGSATVLGASLLILYEGRPVGLLRGGLALNDAFLARLKSANGVDLLAAGADGRVLASTLADSLERASAGDDGGFIVERV